MFVISMLRDPDEGDPWKALGEILVKLEFIPLINTFHSYTLK